MAFTDIAVLLVFLIAILIGWWRGFFRSIGHLIGGVLALFLAYLLTVFTVDSMLGAPGLKQAFYGESGSLAAAIKEKLFSSPSAQLSSLTVAQAAADPKLLGEALGGGIFKVLSGSIIGLINSLNKNGIYSNALVMDATSVLLSRFVGFICVWLLYFIVFKIVAYTIIKVGKFMQTKPVLNTVDRSLGAVLGSVHGLLFCMVMLFILSCFGGFGFMSGYCNDLAKSTIAKPLANISTGIATQYIRLEKITGGLLKSNKDREEAEKRKQKIEKGELSNKSYSAVAGDFEKKNDDNDKRVDQLNLVPAKYSFWTDGITAWV